jgi:hypothetical protein
VRYYAVRRGKIIEFFPTFVLGLNLIPTCARLDPRLIVFFAINPPSQTALFFNRAGDDLPGQRRTRRPRRHLGAVAQSARAPVGCQNIRRGRDRLRPTDADPDAGGAGGAGQEGGGNAEEDERQERTKAEVNIFSLNGRGYLVCA